MALSLLSHKTIISKIHGASSSVIKLTRSAGWLLSCQSPLYFYWPISICAWFLLEHQCLREQCVCFCGTFANFYQPIVMAYVWITEIILPSIQLSASLDMCWPGMKFRLRYLSLVRSPEDKPFPFPARMTHLVKGHLHQGPKVPFNSIKPNQLLILIALFHTKPPDLNCP